MSETRTGFRAIGLGGAAWIVENRGTGLPTCLGGTLIAVAHFYETSSTGIEADPLMLREEAISALERISLASRKAFPSLDVVFVGTPLRGSWKPDDGCDVSPTLYAAPIGVGKVGDDVEGALALLGLAHGGQNFSVGGVDFSLCCPEPFRDWLQTELGRTLLVLEGKPLPLGGAWWHAPLEGVEGAARGVARWGH